MESYQVPRDRARVLLAVPPRPPERRTLFLSQAAATHDGPETVSDLLSRASRFLPAAREDGPVDLIRTGAIRWILVERPEEAEWRHIDVCVGTPAARVRCEFDDDEHLEGTVHAQTPPGRQRVLDLFNRQQGFLHLENGVGLYLVNPDHIRRIAILEEGHVSA
jgi:hypothetical protein